MGKYISASDLNARWGEANITAWSDLIANGKTRDTARIDRAIQVAESRVEALFRQKRRYIIPFQPGEGGQIDPQLTDWIATMAGVWLYDARAVRRGADEDAAGPGQSMQEVERQIAAAAGGGLGLDLAMYRASEPTAPIGLW